MILKFQTVVRLSFVNHAIGNENKPPRKFGVRNVPKAKNRNMDDFFAKQAARRKQLEQYVFYLKVIFSSPKLEVTSFKSRTVVLFVTQV